MRGSELNDTCIVSVCCWLLILCQEEAHCLLLDHRWPVVTDIMESEIVAKGELLYATLFSVLLPRSPLFFIFYMELLNKGSTFIAFTSSLISLSSAICLLSSWLLGSSSILCILWFVLPWRVFSEHDFSIYLHLLDPTHTTSPRFSSWPSLHTSLLMMVAHCVCAAGTSESTYSDGMGFIVSSLFQPQLFELTYSFVNGATIFSRPLGSKLWSWLWVLFHFCHFSHQVICPPSTI